MKRAVALLLKLKDILRIKLKGKDASISHGLLVEDLNIAEKEITSHEPRQHFQEDLEGFAKRESLFRPKEPFHA